MRTFGPFRLDVANQCLWHDETRVALMPKPFAVLRYLVEHAGQLVTHNQLLAAVWPDTHVQPELLRRYILEIRRVLGDSADEPRFIQTLPKRGYQFIAQVMDEPDSEHADGVIGPTTKLVGRVSALATLDRHLRNALGGRRQLVFVVGEPGIGKTSLVDTFQQQAARNPLVGIARGQCVEGFGSKEPYYPVLEALGQLVRGNRAASIVETLATHAPTWMIQFRSLVREDQRAALQREMLGATRERMVRELCEALEVITQTIPILLVLEDLHWADHSTLDLISAIARRRAPAKLLVVGTFRPAEVIVSDSPLKALNHDLTLHRLSHELALERLTESDVAEYLAAEFAPSGLPQGLALLIHKHSDGNPLFMRAILEHLAQQGVLVQADSRWTMTVPLDRVDPGVPETLRQMLEIQLQHLTEGEQQLLECASVAGQHFTAWSVATMLARDLSAVEEKCQALADGQQFLKPSGMRKLFTSALTLEYEFRHSLYREVLYRRLHPTERVNFHRRLAEGLESLRSPVQPEMAAEIALHFEEGREYERAVRYLMLAAKNATKRHAYSESIGLLEHARALLFNVAGADRERLDTHILEKIGDAYYTLGDVERSLETYEAMAAEAARACLRDAEATALMRRAHPAAFVDPSRCVPGCERAVQIGAESGNPTLETHARLLASCWRIMIDGWRKEDADVCAASIAALRRLGADLPPYDQILYARVQVFQSEYAEAYENADRALQRLTEAHGLWVRAKTLSTKAMALLFWGRLGEAHRTVTAGIELAKKNEQAPWLGILISTLTWLRWEVYDFEGVYALSSDLEQSAMSAPVVERIRGSSNVAGATIRILHGFADLGAGRYDRALRCFSEVRDQAGYPKSGLSWHRRMFARLGLTETWLAAGDLANATTEADALVEDVAACGDSYLKARTWEMRVRLALATGSPDSAERYLAQALQAVTAFEVPLAAWRVHATASNLYRETNPSKADTHRAQAKAVVLKLADSLDDCEALRQSFLTASSVRRIVEGDPATLQPDLYRNLTGVEYR